MYTAVTKVHDFSIAKKEKIVYNIIVIRMSQFLLAEDKMVEKNKNYMIEITGISSDGNGIGNIDGFTVFVPMTAVGDVAEIVVVKVLAHYAVGRALHLLKVSDDRAEPECPVFKRCGGCHLQHLKYDAQIRAKKDFIESAFQRIGGFENFKCNEMIGMDNPYRYRNKCIFPVGKDKNNEIVSGFYARRSHDIIPVDDCIMGDAVNSDITKALLEYMRENNVSVYDEKQHTGLVRRIFIRTALYTGEIMVVVSVNGNSIPAPDSFIDKLKNVSGKIVSVYININKQKTNNVLGVENKLIYGKKTITDMLCGIEFKISPHSFYQVNPYMTEKLYGKALEYADIKGSDTVLDVYCGIGTISLAAARNANHTVGVEIVEQAIRDAKENAVANGINNVEFYAQSAQKAVPDLIKKGLRPDIVLLDPPRKGSDEETLSAIVMATPKRIVYVSCNVSTLARDARYLCDNGYVPTCCAGVDMFPHTCHVETVCLLEKQE